MSNNTREIKRRIKSVRNIGQITKAMELVSAAKMRKAQLAATASRPYAVLSGELLRNLLKKTNLAGHPLIKRALAPEHKIVFAQRILAILITSDRGLAGAFNTNVVNKALQLLKEHGNEKFDFITVGKKGADIVHRLGFNIIASFPARDKVSVYGSKDITQIAVGDFLALKFEKVFIIYTDFVSTLVQKANILQLLPFVQDKDHEAEEDIVFEPGADEVLESLINRAVDFAVYQTLVEAAASEHSARMVAMRNANEAAGELIEDLSLTYNLARQAGITRELSEISAAKLAMEG